MLTLVLSVVCVMCGGFEGFQIGRQRDDLIGIAHGLGVDAVLLEDGPDRITIVAEVAQDRCERSGSKGGHRGGIGVGPWHGSGSLGEPQVSAGGAVMASVRVSGAFSML